ncbi:MULTISPECIES: DUF3560 domain-containing protein [Niastella]|uniref:DUF3560 domain-containing protein n=1 Tax=Niastella soli TaxID=2821487 RepID=A0ABS3YW22_9BACT|nr:DUF3560 domain-containing protein [Niastella soli]MBO9202088.1 DUF3560 domain-containing protein [Niastella soli]
MKQKSKKRKLHRHNPVTIGAAKNDKSAYGLHTRVKRKSSYVPMAPPNLISHPAEKRHSRYKDRDHDLQEKSIETSKKSGNYRNPSSAAKNNDAILREHPEVKKLADKIEELESLQDFMKRANKCVRYKDRKGFLKLPGASEKQWQILNTTASIGGIGFAPSLLTNNSQKIRRLKTCLMELRDKVTRTPGEYTIKGVRILKNVEAKRLQLFFGEIPDDEIKTLLKKHRFRWSPRTGAWQRHLNYPGLNAVKEFLNSL